MAESNSPPHDPSDVPSPVPALVLYQLPAAMGLPLSESPPCAKVEVYLRVTKTPYTTELGDTRKSPTKLVPFVRWPDGELQAESGDIIARIEQSTGLDNGLSDERLARGKALVDKAEALIYDACLYDRFADPQGARLQRPLTVNLVARFIPRFLAHIAAPILDYKQARKAKKKSMANPRKGHAAAVATIDEIVALLGDDLFLCGAKPSTVDCAIWPLIVHAGATPNPSPLRDAPGQRPTLVDWVVRFGELIDFGVEPRQVHAPGRAG